MCTARLPVVDWTDAPADLNGLVRFAERRNLVSARVPSRFKRSLPLYSIQANRCSVGQKISPFFMYPEVWTLNHWRPCGAFRGLLVPNQIYELITETYNTDLHTDNTMLNQTDMAIGNGVVLVNFLRSIIIPQDYGSTKNKLGKVCRQQHSGAFTPLLCTERETKMHLGFKYSWGTLLQILQIIWGNFKRLSTSSKRRYLNRQ